MIIALIKVALLAALMTATLGTFPDRLRGGVLAVGVCVVAAVILHFAAP